MCLEARNCCTRGGVSAKGGVEGVLKNTRGGILDDVGKPGGAGGSEGRSRGKRSTFIKRSALQQYFSDIRTNQHQYTVQCNASLACRQKLIYCVRVRQTGNHGPHTINVVTNLDIGLYTRSCAQLDRSERQPQCLTCVSVLAGSAPTLRPGKREDPGPSH